VEGHDFQNDTVELQGWQRGGSSLVADVPNARFAAQIVGDMGAGDLDPVALRKALAGKVANVYVSLTEQAETVRAWTTPTDLDTALQLVYLRLTQPRRDERAFEAWRASQAELVRNRRLSPERSFFEDMTSVLSGNHPRRAPMTPELLAQVDLDKALAAYKARFADFGDFTFTLVGNLDPAKIQPLVETYLGSLPASGRHETWKDIGIKYPTGKVAKTVVAGTEPKSFVMMSFGAPDKWTPDLARDAKVLEMVLDIRLREVLREEMSGVYFVSVWGTPQREPTQRRNFNIYFSCDPANVDKLRDAALKVAHAIEKDGIGADYLEKVRAQLKRERETDLRENEWWLRELHDAAWFGDDFSDLTNLDATLARVTSDRVRASAKHFLDERNTVFGVLRPVAGAKQAAPSAAAPPTRAP
jgi:zinc protease